MPSSARLARAHVASRRSLLKGGAAIAAVALVEGCTNPSNDASSTSADSVSDEGAFPVALQDRYGTVTIPAPPTRIVSLGESDHDILFALGFQPIAVMGANWSMGGPEYPWNQGVFDSEGVTVLNMSETTPFEEIARLGPDLIVNLTGDTPEKEYELLSEMAPTVAQTPGSTGWDVTWEDQAMMIGKAVGKPKEAADLVEQAKDRFAQVRDEHPEFEGQVAIAVQVFPPEYWVRGITDAVSEFLTGIGFDYAKQENGKDFRGFATPISAENLSFFDQADVAIFDGDASDLADLSEDPVYQQTRLYGEGRALMAPARVPDNMLAAGLLLQNVVSLPWTIENALPRIVAALDGDPSTDPNA